LKRGFIRGLWGIFDNSNRITGRRFSVSNDIADIQKNQFNEPFVTYVMGIENFDLLKAANVKDIVLLDEEPFRFDLVKYQYRNKIEVIANAFQNDGYDELIYLDWDCVPQKKLPVNFWGEIGKREIFQANLQAYKRPKAQWRERDHRVIPNGGFLYIRDKKVSELAVQKWEEIGKPDNDEIVWANITDEMVGGWQGIEEYWSKFESMFSNLHKGSPYSRELTSSKDVCFIHYQG
jgi:hypothetical protein